MAYTQLTLAQRNYIEMRLKQRDSQNQIARDMNRSQSTISRELARNTGLRGYRHTQANKKAKQCHTNKPKAIKMTMELTDHIDIDMMLQQQWSPEQISGRLKWKDKNSEVIGPMLWIVPKKHKVSRLWQSRRWRCKRPIEQWCILPVE